MSEELNLRAVHACPTCYAVVPDSMVVRHGEWHDLIGNPLVEQSAPATDVLETAAYAFDQASENLLGKQVVQLGEDTRELITELHPVAGSVGADVRVLLGRWLSYAEALGTRGAPPAPAPESEWEQLGKAEHDSYVYQNRHEWRAKLGAQGVIKCFVQNDLPVFLRGRTNNQGNREYQLVQRPADAPEGLSVSDAQMVVLTSRVFV